MNKKLSQPIQRFSFSKSLFRAFLRVVALGAAGLLPATAGAQATHFAFVPPSSPAALYTTAVGSNAITIVVQAQDSSNSVVTGFNHSVVAGLYSTATSQVSDPQAVYQNAGTTFIGSFPLSWVSGVASFSVTFEAGSDSEQIVLQDQSPGAITSGTTYPGSLGVTTGAAMTVRGFLSQPFFPQDADFIPGNGENPPTDDTPFHYMVGGPTDPLATDDSQETFFGSGDYGDLVPTAGGAAGSSGIDTNASCYLLQNYNGGYSAGGAGVSVHLWFSDSVGTAPVSYQVILDYDGSLTDYNNPNSAKDTVLQGTFTSGVGYGIDTNVMTPVAGFQPYQPFMQGNGQLIFRVWTAPGNSVTMKYANFTNGANNDNTISFIKIPYSPQNVLPLRSTVTAPSYTGVPPTPPYVLAGFSPTTIVDTFQNQYSSSLVQIIFQIPADPLGVTNWNITSVPPPSAANPSSSTGILEPTGTTAGAITLNFNSSNPVTTNETFSVSIIGQSPATAYSWPLSILSATTGTASNAPIDSASVAVNTLQAPDKPGSFSAAATNYAGVGNQISLTWNQSVSQNPLGYVLSRNPGAASGNPFGDPVTLPSGLIVSNAITLVPSVTTSYLDTTVANLAGYTYSIQSFNNVTQSAVASVGPVTAFANPGPPGPVTALTGGTTVRLSWSAPASASGSYPVTAYQIYRGTSANGENSTPLASVTTSLSPVTYVDTPPTAPGTSYYYYLSAIDNHYSGGPTFGAHDSGPSAEVSGFPPGNPPSINIPTLLSSSPATILVSWTPPSNVLNTPLSNYYLYRAVTTGSFAAYITLGGGATSYNDTAVTAGSYYSYEVQAVDSLAVTSNLSVAVTGRVGPPSPATPTAAPSATGVTLIWPAVANSTGETIVNYVVYRNSTAIASPVTTAGASQTYVDSGITLGTDYFYQVAAEDQASVIGGLSGGVSSALLPPAPSSVAVSLVLANDNVAVTWATPAPTQTNLQSYTLTQALNAAAATTIASPAASAVSYYDPSITLLNAGQTVTYKLSAKNDVGGVGLQTAVSLVVPPNAPTALVATASASAITLNWNGLSGQGVTQYTVSRVVNPGPVTTVVGSTASGAVSTLTDNSVALAEGTNYVYFVTAKNAGGYGLNSTTVTSALLPLVPASLTAAVSGTGTQFNAGVTWSAPVSSGNLTGYNLIRNNVPTLVGATNLVSGGPVGTTNYADTLGLGTAGTTIFYFIQGVNPGGAGPTSMVGFQVPPNPPTSLVSAPTTVSVAVTWHGLVGQNVSNYTLYRINPGPAVVTIGSTGSGAVTTLTDTGSVSPLAQGVTYQYYVTATNPGGGVGVPGGTSLASVTINSGLAAPAPTGLQVSSIDTSNNINVAWTNVTGAAPNATGVTLFGGPTSVLGSATPVPLATPVVSFNDNGVFSGSVTGEKPDTIYYYWLETVNPFGPSAPAGPVSQLTYPAAVSIGNVVLNSDGSRSVTWKTVGNGDVTSYNIYREQIGGSGFVSVGSFSAAGLNLPVTLSNPTLPGKQYGYEVTAVNSTGEGTSQNVVTIGVPPSDPSPVTALTGLSTSAEVSLSWPANAAGEGVTSYSVYRGTTPTWSAATSLGGGAVTTYLDNAPLGGTTYYYWVEAQDGDGVFSLPTSFTSAVTIAAAAQPNAPTGLTETDGNASAALSWTGAVSTTFPITGYNLYDSANGGATVKANATPVAGAPSVVPGLTNGVSYNLWVQAVDSHGNLSPLDGPVLGLPDAPPGVPGNVSGSSGNSAVQITWSPSLAGTQPVGSYLVEKIAAGVTTYIPVPGNQTGYVDSPLTNGNPYTYLVEAVDSTGVTTGSHVSGFSTLITVSAGLITVNPPSNVTAIGGVNLVKLSWVDPSTGSTVNTYQVFRAETAPAPSAYTLLTSTAPGASPLTDATAANGNTYGYYMVAFSSGVPSAHSATIFATAAAPPAAPSPVSLLDGGQENLSWGASPNQGAVTIQDYLISQVINSGAPATFTTTGPVTAYTDSTPLIGNTVVYQVGAVNSNGTTGLFSPAITGYLYTPMTITNLASTDTTSAVTLTWTGISSPTWGPVQYNILRTTLTGSFPTTILNVTSPYPDTTGALGQLYLYTVTAVDAKGHASVGGGPVTDGPLNPPAAPTPVVATAGNQQVLFDWAPSAPVSGSLPVSSYLVSINGGAPFTLPATVTSYLDLGLLNGTPVTAFIRAVDATGNPVGNHLSPPVTDGPATASGTLLNPPTGAAVTAASPTTNVLTWNRPNDEGFIVTGYNIYRSTAFTTVLGSPIATLPNPALNPVTVFTDNGVSANTTYFYVITANYQQGASTLPSPPSNHAWDTTPAPQAGVPPVTPGQMAFDANLLKPLTGQVLNIYFIAPNSGNAEIDVYNVSGNPIRALFATAVAGTQVSLAWDGKDRNGNTVASGIYLVEIKGPGIHLVRKVLVVK